MSDHTPPGDPTLRINGDMAEALRTPYRAFAGKEPEQKYIAFLDILGFGNAVLDQFESTLKIYEALLDKLRILKCIEMGVSIQVASDSIILTSGSLESILSMCKLAHAVTLLEHCLIRGGIGYGKHIDVKDGDNGYVVSQALVNAVHVEKTVRWPCVAIHHDIRIDPKFWFPRNRAISRSVVRYEGLNLVCPLNLFWGSTAIDRVEQMKEQFPEHSKKYDWFLSFAEQILIGAELVPEDYKGL